VNGHKNMMGSVISLHAKDLSGGMTYHPMLVGETFLAKSGALKLVVGNFD